MNLSIGKSVGEFLFERLKEIFLDIQLMDPLSEFEFVCSLSKQPSPLEFFTDSSGVFNLKSDLTLIVGTMKFYCHRSVLSLTSPVLTRMFDGEFQEHHAREVPLKGKTSESILELLTYIYPQFHREINDRNVENFISLADEYMIEFLKKPCQEFLAQQLESFKVVVLPTQQKFEKVRREICLLLGQLISSIGFL